MILGIMSVCTFFLNFCTLEIMILRVDIFVCVYLQDIIFCVRVCVCKSVYAQKLGLEGNWMRD